MKLDTHTPERAANLARWKRNRDHAAGADVVKKAGTAYLPRPVYMTGTEGQADYLALLAGTEYFPAAARTLQSFIGLIFRKSPAFAAPQQMTSLGAAITATGATIEEFAKDAFASYALTNDGAILVDFPEANERLTVAEAIARDIRPFLSFYTAESILEVRHSVRQGRKALAYARLADSADQVRELSIENGVYQIVISQRDNDAWVEVSRTYPSRNGQPLSVIPLVLLNDGAKTAAFDDLCEINNVHYHHSSKLSIALKWISSPIVTAFGISDDTDLLFQPGALWRFNKDATASYLEYKGEGVPAIERQLERIEKHLAWLGSRMLASEKAAAEAAETVARRHASENSILASMARHVSQKIESALKLCAEWWGLNVDQVSFVLNNDFAPVPVDPSLLAQVTQLNMSGKLPDEAFYQFLTDGEILKENWTFERYMDSIETDRVV